MSINNALFSSAVDTHETPQDFFDAVDRVFNFDLDACALDDSAKCANYFTPETDAFKQDWKGNVWMNPPYGRGITGKWMEYAANQSRMHGSTVVCLVPSRTDTGWFHKAMEEQSEGVLFFVKGRLKFGGSKTPAPFPSCLIVFSPDLEDAQSKLIALDIKGWVSL